MCGIYGMVSWQGSLAKPEAGARMAGALTHRGPDGTGQVAQQTFLLGTQHLRIVSPHGPPPQPFVDASGSVYLICNGEIYNATILRRRSPRYQFRTANDVEPILARYLERGIHALTELDGMFALAILDMRERKLILARDRAGEKPLFCATVGRELWFASEISALLAAGVPRRVDQGAIRDLVALGYAREPLTPFQAVRKVEAGTALVIASTGSEAVRFWQPERIAEQIVSSPERALDGMIHDAVRRQLQSDVPLGVFLSGGVDSSLIASMAAREPAAGPTLFTVGFENPSYDERDPAEFMARRLDLPHIDVTADAGSLCEAHEHLTKSSAEPLTDPAAMPTWLLAREARRHVKVVLSGEGADELFGGYPTYVGHRIAQALQTMPPRVLDLLRKSIAKLPSSDQSVPLEFLIKRLVAEAGHTAPMRHHAWFGSGLAGEIAWEPNGAIGDVWAREPDTLRAAMLVDYLTYLRDGLLPKIDRATMQCSLEARAPFLDHAVTTFALGLPTFHRIDGLRTKTLLRQVAARHLPARILRRRKRGLSVPISHLLSYELRPDVDRVLGHDQWPFPGVLQSRRVEQLLSEHWSGRRNHARPLWTLFTIAKWNAEWAGDCG